MLPRVPGSHRLHKKLTGVLNSFIIISVGCVTVSGANGEVMFCCNLCESKPLILPTEHLASKQHQSAMLGLPNPGSSQQAMHPNQNMR